VRAVKYESEDPGRPTAEDSTYRLVATVLDLKAAPAAELAGLYAKRSEFESALDELKTHQQEARIVFGSRDLRRRCSRGLGHALRPIRDLSAHVAWPQRVRLTRTGSASPARCAACCSVRRTVDDLTTGLSRATAEILHELLPTGACARSPASCAPR